MVKTWMLILILTFAGAIFGLPSASGQSGVQIVVTGYTIQCDQFRVLYTVTDPANGYYEAQLNVYTASGTHVGSTNGPGQPGFPYAVDIPVSPAQPEQTSLYVVIELYNGGTLITSTSTTPDPCYGGGTGTPSQPPSNSPAVVPWNGYSDGRLNPDPAEYYTIYCEYSSIKVYGRSNDPNNLNPALVEVIPISLVESLSPNGGQMIWNTGFLVPYRVSRNGDTIIIEGNFGYQMPQQGIKTFSLSQCKDRAAATANAAFNFPEIKFCIDYEGNGYTDPECIRASQNTPGSTTSRPFP